MNQDRTAASSITHLFRKISAAKSNRVRATMLLNDVLGIDRAVAWINITTAWSSIKGPITVFFIVTYLSSAQQGLWYTFADLAALSVFAELGFSVIVSQFVSHEYSRLQFLDGQVRGESYYVDRFVSLCRYAIKFYVVVVMAAIAILSLLGSYYFRNQAWGVVAAWIFFSLASGIQLFTGLLQGIYRGLDRVADTQKALLASTVVATLCTWGSLFFGLTVWALPVGAGAYAAVLLVRLVRLAPAFWKQLYRHKIVRKFSWTREVIWLQGKYALTFASTYFIFNLAVPVVFKTKGPVVAGQLGLAMQIVSSVQSLATAAVTASIPKLNMLIASGKSDVGYRLVRKMTIICSFFYISGMVVVLGAVIALTRLGIYRERLLSLPLFALLAIYSLAPTLTSSASAFLRAHKEEPHLPIAVVTGLFSALGVFVILPRFGLLGLLLTFNACFWLIAAPWILYLLADYRRRDWTQLTLGKSESTP